jgi:quercetin dioxygenase-like cupin family protein
VIGITAHERLDLPRARGDIIFGPGTKSGPPLRLDRAPFASALPPEPKSLIMDYPISTPSRLSGLVDYHADSVVSRVILRNAGGTLTVFAFAEGQGLSEHSNPNDAVILVLEGTARVTIDGADHVVEQGEALHLPASIPHELLGGVPFKMLLTLVKGRQSRQD